MERSGEDLDNTEKIKGNFYEPDRTWLDPCLQQGSIQDNGEIKIFKSLYSLH